METLLVRQHELKEKIESIGINFGKDSSSRKTPEYLQKRLEALKSFWSEFDDNNSKLIKVEDKSHEYFTLNIYEQVKKGFEIIFKQISSYKLTTTEERASSSKTDELKGLQRTNFRAFSRVVRSINVDKISEKWELEDKLQMLNFRWKAIDQLHWQIDNLLVGSDAFYEMEFAEHEHTYEDMKKKLNRKLCSTTHQHQSTPQIELPTFSGNYTQWPTFMDLYVETIHKNSLLTNAQKMQHLKGKLRGEAEKLVQHLNVSAENYVTCWDILQHRYNNIQLLFTKQIQLFMNQPTIHKQTSYELKRLHDISMETIHSIQNLGIDTTTWDPILVYILTEKLDSETYTAYMESRKAPRELPVFDEFMEFLENKFTALEPLNRKNKSINIAQKQSSIQFKQNTSTISKHNLPKPYYKTYHTNFHRNCPICKTDHILFHCETFKGMTPENKLNIIEQLNICKNCLYCHNGKGCNSFKRCKECNREHHTALHDFYKLSSSLNQQKPIRLTKPSSSQSETKSNHATADLDEVLLATLMLKVKSADGTYVQMRALLDQGSQVSLVTERAVQILGIPKSQHSGTVTGVGTSANQSKGVVQITCQSIYGDHTLTTDALVMTKVLNNLPNNTFPNRCWTHIQNINLADPDYNISRPVDILLDASVYSDIILEGILRGPEHAPIAQQTRMGWILFGNVKKTFNCHVTLNNLDEISQFWEIEDISDKCSSMTSEDEQCEQLYQQTTKRLSNGRFQVRIPMKTNFEQNLGQSRSQAIAQFLQLEKRMKRDKVFADSYKQFINEYLELNHMKECKIPSEPSCLLPHHGVIRQDSTTTKLRVVFNASAKTQSGHSLNELMLCGPNLQQNLLTLILRWRKYKYVFTADIEKFYRQILIHEEDQHLQKIVWRNSSTENITEYQLRTVTYGTKSAPFLAMRTMKQLVKDDGHNFPLATETLNNELYMDDILAGNNNMDTAIQTQLQLNNILHGAGFNLRKFTSNNRLLLEHLSPEQISDNMFDFKYAQSNKTLGLKWNPCNDQFSFKYELSHTDNSKTITKRLLLSDISKLYDPLGWLSPITVKGKIIFQNVWASCIGWDDPLPQSIQTEWPQFANDLQNISKFILPRHIGNTDGPLELHEFCDASEKAYSCVIYCTSITENGDTNVKLVAGKTKLTPLNKKVSIPRLELCGAVLLSRLMNKVTEAFQGNDIKIYGWTDSLVVLGWLQGNPSQWKTFVANRVTEITSSIPSTHWRHLPSDQNPADCASRGLLPSQLLTERLWWEGPACCRSQTENQWAPDQVPVPTLETKTKQTCATQVLGSTFVEDILRKYSSMTLAIRIVCWITRFITNLRNKCNAVRTMHLTASEINESRKMIIKTVQSTTFTDDIIHIKQHGFVRNKSNILQLNPFIDTEGILRVGGRLSKSHLDDNQKHPIILPNNHRLTELLIDHGHKMTLHGGARLTLAFLRNNYWILGGHRVIKKQIRQCIKCKRFNISKTSQLMADLPSPRVVPSKPFTHCGVDFTGQVEVKANKGRGIKTTKGYVCIFVCLSTKAVHLELVSDLSTDAFLAAFKRMCGRRGLPQHMYSDQGTNFIGAAKILKKEYTKAMKHYINTEFLNHIADLQVQWHFNAPAWPSAGGLWEAAVRSMKHHLKRVIGEQKLTFEEFSTLLTQIEACLNSRPLVSLTEDTEDLEYLSPAHFLTTEPLLSSPLSIDTDNYNIRTRWQLTDKMHKHFWKKWSSEYLHTLQTRGKWNTIKRNLEIDDVVLIKEDNLPPSKWLLGRVTQLHPGKDGLVRVVTIKTKNGFLKRPIIKLSLLPIYEETETIKKKSDKKINTTETRERRKPNRFGITYLCTALLFFLSLLMPSTQQIINVTALESTKLVYFDKISNMQLIENDWNLIVYFNMTTYWDNFKIIENYTQHLAKLCKEKTAFLTIAAQFQHDINELKHYNNLLKVGYGTRSKRGLINGVGYIANSLFGVLDERFAEKYRQDIQSIQNNENHMIELYKQQTSIIEGEYNLIKRNEQVMNKQFTLIDKHLQSTEDRIRLANEDDMYITSSALAASGVIANLHRVQQSLLDVVTDVRNGRLDIHLVQPDQLTEQLNIISRQLPRGLSLPVINNRDHLRELYKLLRIHSRLTDMYMIFEVKIPLVNSDQYEIYNIIPIPQRKELNSLSIIPTSKYIAINLQRDTFMPLHNDDMHACLPFDKENIFCSTHQPVYNLKSKAPICEIQIINNEITTNCKTETTSCSDKWIQLHDKSVWFFSCCEECLVRIFCTADMTYKSLRGAGLVTVKQGCLLKSDTLTIHSYQNLSSKMQGDIKQNYMLNIPEINHVITNLSSHLFVPENHAEVLTELKNKIDHVKLQQETTSKDLSYHDIHHYTLLYVIVTAAIAILVWWVLPKIKAHCSQRTRNDADRQPPSNIELQPRRTQSMPGDINSDTVLSETVYSEIKRPVSVSVVNKTVDRATSPTPVRLNLFDK